MTDQPGLFPTPEDPRAPAIAAGLFAQVAVDRPMRCEYTYAVPEHLAPRVAPGVRVAVPFAGRRVVAVVVGTPETCDVPAARLKALADVLDPEPIVDAALLDLTRWMAGYYACSWGETLAAVLPALLKREGGRRKVAMLAPAPGVGPEELASLEGRYVKQHRVLRTLLDLGGAIEKRELLTRLGLSDSPVTTLVRKGWVNVEYVEQAADDLTRAEPGAARVRPAQLLEGQAHAVDAIVARLDAREFTPFLLRGVTGSGKTEVYLRVIEAALEAGRGAIVLVPEIALTPQTVGWFRSRFGDVAVLHSRMTDAQRLEMWMRVKRGELRVVVGARSAVFAPVPELGVIVVDEEHEPSFKQSNAPRYNARDVAVVRARNAGAVCVLGSATPSLESWHNAHAGRYELLELTERASGGELPNVQVIDMRNEPAGERGPALFSRHLVGLLEDALERREQAILFLNRRGFSPILWCQACGETVKCAQCDVSLTWHRRIARLVCHSCYDERVEPKECPSCTAPSLRFLGVGSERVEDVLARVLPDARIARMDSDTMLRREDYERTLNAFGEGELDVLVGTQMIAKGLDFPRVTVVGIVSADSSLHLPDVRAGERTFQLLSQVAGRAGRADLEGNIVIQTVTPEHPAIVHAARHDFEAFARTEMVARQELGYPPFGRLIRVVVDDEDEARTRETIGAIAEALLANVASDTVSVLGPAPAPVALQRGRHRHHLLIKAVGSGTSLALARTILAELAAKSGRTRVAIDVDPVGML